VVPASANQKMGEGQGAPDDEFGGKDLRSILSLKNDHGARPLWVVR
jgi:hypothetical protein